MYFIGYNIRIASIEGTVFIITDKRSLGKEGLLLILQPDKGKSASVL